MSIQAVGEITAGGFTSLTSCEFRFRWMGS